MDPSSGPVSAWHEVLIGAAGNMVGGFAATLLWWVVTSHYDRRRGRRERKQKQTAIALEIAKIRARMKMLQRDPSRASMLAPDHGGAVLTALLRLGPALTENDQNIEPKLGELVHRLLMVDAASSRLFASTVGMAAALRGNEDELAELQTQMNADVNQALLDLDELEAAIIQRK